MREHAPNSHDELSGDEAMSGSARFAGVALLAAGLFAAGVVQADDDPSLYGIYKFASADHLDQAQTVMTQVLRDHPRSGKAKPTKSRMIWKRH